MPIVWLLLLSKLINRIWLPPFFTYWVGGPSVYPSFE
jgi:hypothetical protein